MASAIVNQPADSAAVRSQLDRILKSEAFHKAESLRHLLEYLVTQAASGQSEQIKESVVAIEVFGRADFDGRIDNIVRVQAHRLRKLLDAYYAQEGQHDEIRILVPKGGYVPQFTAHVVPAADEPCPRTPVSTGYRKRLGLAFVSVFVAGLFAGGVASPRGGWLSLLIPSRADSVQPPSPAVAELWKGIFEPGLRVVVSFTNPAFLRVGRSHVFLLYRGPLNAPAGAIINLAAGDPYMEGTPPLHGEPLYFNEGWTGTGEVLAMSRLTTLSSALRSSLVAVPSRSLALSAMRGGNVIFLGSPWGNGELSKLGADSAPMYVNDEGAIVVRDPAAGEQPSYQNAKNRVTQEITASYTLFSVLPGLDGGRKIVSSAGLCTWATWAGIDFATTSSGAAQIEQALRSANGGKLPPYFQAVVRTQIVKGSASNTTLVTTRTVAAVNGG